MVAMLLSSLVPMQLTDVRGNGFRILVPPRLTLAWAMVLLLPFQMGEVKGQPLQGRASVIDGDTIEISGQRFRLDEIDAPESWQTCINKAGEEYHCGRLAADKLDDFLAKSRPTKCIPTSLDRYGRMVGNCFRADGASVAAWMVRNGLAVVWPRYSQGTYDAEQTNARSKRRGIWEGDFLDPWEARRQRLW